MAHGLTTTSYAILGLLAIGPWSTYELAKQMRRNLHYLCPRAESNIYAESKRLVEVGFAEVQSRPRGKRPRTVYSITREGRKALEHWLRKPGHSSKLESEALVKLMFATYGSKHDLLNTLRRFRDDAQSKRMELAAIFGEYLKRRRPLSRASPH